MKRLGLVIILLSSIAFGQGSLTPPQQALKVVNGITSPIANATITVCPANSPGIPCSPSNISIFKDAALTQSLTNPFFADGVGNYLFAAAPGNYTVTVSALGFAGYSYQYNAPLAVGANNNFTGTNTFTGPTNLNAGGTLAGSFGGPGTFTGMNNFTGNNTFSGNVTATAGQNTFNFFKHNAIVWAGPESGKYTTVEGSLGDSQCTTTPGGCEAQLSSNFAETFTSTITLSNSNNQLYQHIHGWPNSKFTCNITGGTQCFLMNGPSGFTGDLVGSSSGGSNGGFMFTWPSTANFSCLFCTPTAQSGGTSYESLEKLFVYGNASATVPAVIDLVGVNNLPMFDNFYVVNFPSVGIQARSGSASNSPAGPLSFYNVWSDGSANAGARPWVFTADATSHNSILGIDITGGVANHPGTGGKAMMEFTGNSAGSATMRGIFVHGTYFEDLTVNNGSIAIKNSDVQAAFYASIPMTIPQNGTGVDINQSGAGRTCNITVQAMHESSASNGANAINNHITGFTTSGPNVPFYTYGGDSSCSLVPFTVESLPAVFTATGNAAIAVPVGEVTSKFSGATLHAFVAQDTEASGKTVGFGPGSVAATRFSFVDTTDSNTELFDCTLSTTGGCAASHGITVGTSGPVATQNAVNMSEVAAPTCVSGVDSLVGNSTAHAAELCNNGNALGVVHATVASTGAVTIGSGTSIAATSLCSTTACPAGRYRVDLYVDITTACTTTGSYIVWLGYTDDQGAKAGSSTTTYFAAAGGLGVTPATATTGATLALASTANFLTGTYTLTTTGAATGGLGSINYGTTAVACGTGGPMVGKMYLDVTRLE